MLSKESKIFAPYRFLGGVCNEIPFSLQNNHKLKENFIVTSIGKAWHRYNCTNLAIVEVGELLPKEITALTTSGYYIFAAYGHVIQVYCKQSQTLKNIFSDDHDRTIIRLCALSDHLLALDEGNCIVVWNYKTGEIFRELNFDQNTFKITCMLHPSTFLNKFLFASSKGGLNLWNIKTAKLIHSFSILSEEVAVTTLEQSSALEVVAVGFADGRIVLLNIVYDQILAKLKQQGVVMCLAFSSSSWMASGSDSGSITFWDLKSMVIGGRLKKAHNSSVISLSFLPNDSVLVSSSDENSLKSWRFDDHGTATLLHHRAGHSSSISKISFYNEDLVLSTDFKGQLRALSLSHDSNGRLLGNHSIKIEDVVSETNRQSDWDSIFCIHENSKALSTWNYRKTRSSPRMLDNEDSRDVVATALSISTCGNFVLMGYSDGSFDRFNVQSGNLKVSYSNNNLPLTYVSGIFCDIVNSSIISFHSDGLVVSWAFSESKVNKASKLNCSVSRVCHSKTRNFIALSTSDQCVLIIDTNRPHSEPIRHWSSFSSTITDLTFSPDSRWLVLSFSVPVIRVLDIPSNSVIDCFEVEKAVTSLSFSPDGVYLATCHGDDKVVHIWANSTLYYENSVTEPIPQVESSIEDSLVRLSSIPSSRFQNILEYSAIKRRNKENRVVSNAPILSSNLNSSVLGSGDRFRTILAANNDFEGFMDLLKGMSMSSLHLEFSLLDLPLMDKFLDFVRSMLLNKVDIDLVLSYLALFIEKCGNELRSNRQLMDKLVEIKMHSKSIMDDLNKLMSRSESIMAYIKNSTY